MAQAQAAAEVQKLPPTAVSAEEFRAYGCPNCGSGEGTITFCDGKTALITCSNPKCGYLFGVLNDAFSLHRTTVGIGHCHPTLSVHPRRGIPAEGSFSKALFGEFFTPRGIVVADNPGCYACGGKKNHYHRLAGFVTDVSAGRRVVEMFTMGSWLDYLDRPKDHIQVKVGACGAHLPNLRRLNELTRLYSGFISQPIVEASLAL